MKTIILSLSSLLLSFIISGQETGKSTTSGKIVFEERIKIEIKLEGEAAAFAQSLPKEQVSNKTLLFNVQSSLYQTEEKKSNDEIMTQQSGGVQIRMFNSGGNDKTFNDLSSKKIVEQKEFMTRMFLVESDAVTAEWKLTGNFRIIQGYNCQEATREDSGKKITAWFAPAIPVASGPAGYTNLPGMVLMVDVENGKRLITAISVEPDFNVTGMLTAPKEGKKVTKEEYKKMVDDKMKEMGSEGGEGGNHVMIRIKN